MLTKRPKARLKIGQQYIGQKIAATAQGYVIYKEYDQVDRKNYYWEEWELTGFNDYDSWIEYDHYTEKITLYEPIDLGLNLDPQQLSAGQSLSTTVDGRPVTLQVKEVGAGTVERREGTLTYHVFKGDVVAYAELTSNLGTISVEKYNEKEYDIYLGRVLSKTAQKVELGRVIEPTKVTKNLKSIIIWAIFGPLFLVVLFADSLFPSYQSYCTPRTAASNTQSRTITTGSTTTTLPAPSYQPGDEVTSQDANQTCYRRRIYGGGSGGAGK